MLSPLANTTTESAERQSPAPDVGMRKRKSPNDETTASGARRFRASRACQYCRTRKVRCDVLRNDAGCTNCRLDGRECVLLASRRGKTEHWLGCAQNAREEQAAVVIADTVRSLSVHSATHEDRFSPDTTSTAVESAPGGDVPVCVTFNGDNEHIGHDRQPTENGHTTDYTPSESFDVLTFVSHDSSSTTLHRHCGLDGMSALPSFIAPFRGKIPPEDIEFLARKGALTIPEPELRVEILKGYIFSVFPYMPMCDLKQFVDAVMNERNDCRVSLLLFQAVMFAGLSSLEQHHLHRLGFENAKQAREVFFTRVKLLYEFDIELDSEAVFQSLLLMSSWYSKWNEWRDTSYWTAQALLVAQNMGLHREPISACGSDKMQGHRRRMWWSLYIRDRMLALGTRRPMRIRDDDFDVAMLSLEDFDIQPLTGFGQDQPGFLDIEEQKCTARLCIELAKLCVCIGHVLSTQYTTLSTKPTVSHTTMVVPKRNGQRSHELQKCDAEISEWLKQLSTTICRPPSSSQQTGTTSCSEVHWAMLNLAHLTLVNVLHRTQALQPFSNAAEAQSIRTASRLKVKEAACKVTKIAQTMLHRNQVRFLGLNGITALLAACLAHMVDIRTGNDDVRDASIFRFEQNMQVLHALRGMYTSADAAVSFLASVIRKVRPPLPAQVIAPTPYFTSAPPNPFASSWLPGNDLPGLSDNIASRGRLERKPCSPPRISGAITPPNQFLPSPQLPTQVQTVVSSDTCQRDPESTAEIESDSMCDGVKNRTLKDQRNFCFDDILFDNAFNPSIEEQALDTNPVMFNYDFFLDNFEFPDGQLKGVE